MAWFSVDKYVQYDHHIFSLLKTSLNITHSKHIKMMSALISIQIIFQNSYI